MKQTITKDNGTTHTLICSDFFDVEGLKADCIINDPLKIRPKHIGYYSTELEAHLAWKERKHKYALEIAEKEEDPRVKIALLNRYK